jgi:murein L,D-transpeptidase YcbB/YkuD
MLPSGAALAEQFHTPEAATKPKVIKKAVRHPFRPTMPARNPVRPVSAAAEPSDEAATTDEDQADEEPIVVTNLLPPADPFEAAETKPAEALAPETEQASDTDDSEKSDNATETADEMSNKPAEQPTVVTDLSPPEDPFELDETDSAETEPANDTVVSEKPGEVVEAAENSSDEPASASEKEQASEAEESNDAPEAVAAPSHDATVVIEVLPPDDVAAADQPEAETSDDDEPIEPSPTSVVAADDEEAETSEAEAAPDAVEFDTSEAEAASAAAESVEPAASEAESATDDADDETETLVETVPEVVEPPAHPVVAAIRVTLADPDFRRGVRPAALKALESFYETHHDAPVWITESGFSTNAQALIAEIGKASDWGLDARAFDVPNSDGLPSTPEEQAAAELKLDMAILKYARFAQGGRLTPSRISKLFDQRPSLRDPKTVLADLASADAPSDILASFHPQHQHFKRLQAALVKARANNNTRDIQLIAINMERWRWMPRQLGSLHVWNNVPEFNTRVVKNGRNIYQEKTIVGQLKYATPFFSASMRDIVVHPDWTLPPTILNEDIAPNLQKPKTLFGQSNMAFLRYHKIRVSLKGEPINPDEVDWNKVSIHKYTFTQPSGPTNVLGQFKFNFPNKHAIYMHDTPQRDLFGERVRTFSHGCIRVHQPARLAALLLAEDQGWSAAKINALVAQGENKVIALRRPVPVHLTYFTLTVGEDGRLQTFADIYGLDGRMAPKLFDKPVKFSAPADPVIAEANMRTRNRGRTNQQTGGGLGGLISGLFGN